MVCKGRHEQHLPTVKFDPLVSTLRPAPCERRFAFGFERKDQSVARMRGFRPGFKESVPDADLFRLVEVVVCFSLLGVVAHAALPRNTCAYRVTSPCILPWAGFVSVGCAMQRGRVLHAGFGHHDAGRKRGTFQRISGIRRFPASP